MIPICFSLKIVIKYNFIHSILNKQPRNLNKRPENIIYDIFQNFLLLCQLFVQLSHVSVM